MSRYRETARRGGRINVVTVPSVAEARDPYLRAVVKEGSHWYYPARTMGGYYQFPVFFTTPF